MMFKQTLSLSSLVVLLGVASTSVAGTDMENALAGGAKQMTAEEIAERLAGKTVAFQPNGSEDKWLFYYDGMNGTLSKKIGAGRTSEGFYAVSLVLLRHI